MPYTLNSALFTDYAQKLRTVWMPEGTTARYGEDSFEFPVGTVLSKTFYYPTEDRPAGQNGSVLLARAPETVAVSSVESGSGLDLSRVRLLETRLLVKRDTGWVALPYVWNADQTDATLEVAGTIERVHLLTSSGEAVLDGADEVPYIVPDANQCAGCHATDHTAGDVLPVGPRARHLNRDFPYADGSANQLERWLEAGYLDRVPSDAPRLADWKDETLPLDERARAYLDINCGHCHNPNGPADTSGLFLDVDTMDKRQLGVCKPPVAAGRGSGDLFVAIEPGKPDESIMTFRMASIDPGEAMPELGRSTVHKEGVDLIRQWIASLDPGCES